MDKICHTPSSLVVKENDGATLNIQQNKGKQLAGNHVHPLELKT